MFAVIKTGGKQYRVAENDQFEIERLNGEAGDTLSFSEVLMVGTAIGTPFVAGATVTAEIVRQTRGPKVISFKKRRRQNSKRKRGHRQDLTLIRVSGILTDGQQSAGRPAAVVASNDSSPTSSAPEEPPKVKAAETSEAGVVADVVVEAPAKKPRAPRRKDDAGEGEAS